MECLASSYSLVAASIMVGGCFEAMWETELRSKVRGTRRVEARVAASHFRSRPTFDRPCFDDMIVSLSNRLSINRTVLLYFRLWFHFISST
jgi:hypothetical protein